MNTGKQLFRVAFSCRKVGAIGTFGPASCTVEATDKDDAVERARAQLYGEGYEHLHLDRVVLIGPPPEST